MASGQYKTVKEAMGPAVFAKNIRVTSNGFSPHQIVFGQNPRIPGAIENELPAQSGKSELSLIQDRLQALYNAKNTLSRIDNTHRLEKAENTTHSSKMVFVEQGEEVYYRMGMDHIWAVLKVLGSWSKT